MRNVVKSILLAFMALAILALPVVAGQEVSNTLETDMDTTYPIRLTWAPEVDGAVGNYTDGDLDIDWEVGEASVIWFKSECTEDLHNLFLVFQVGGTVEITPVGFEASVEHVAGTKMYTVGPEEGFSFNSTIALCFEVTPTDRGYYVLKVQWVEEA